MVAEEVRYLAEQSGEAAKEIGQIIAEVQRIVTLADIQQMGSLEVERAIGLIAESSKVNAAMEEIAASASTLLSTPYGKQVQIINTNSR